MWILPKQLHTSASVVDTAESDSALNEFYQTCEKSLMWRSKPSLLRTWSRRWKPNKFLQHLYSRMLRRSHTNDFLDAWTFYQGDSRVNRLAKQELEGVLKTLDTSIPTSVKESKSADPELFSSKTWKESSQVKQKTENQFSSMSSATWKAWVTEQRQEYSQRLKWEHLTRENESSSWATPNVCGNHNRKGASKTSGDGLSTQAKNWATPNTMDTLPARSPEKLAEAKKKGGCKNLREEVMNWATPKELDSRRQRKLTNGKNVSHTTGVEYGMFLEQQTTQLWPIPTTAEGTKIGNQANYGQKGLSNHPEIVGEPTREKGTKSYPTPTARDWKGTYKTVTRKDGKSRMDNLPQVADSLQDPTNVSTNGSNHVLNPDWVEQLMGLPVGWTDLDSWAMESYQLPQPEHSKY